MTGRRPSLRCSRRPLRAPRSSACRSSSTAPTSARWRSPPGTTGPKQSPTAPRSGRCPDVARQCGTVLVVPVYEVEQPGVLYNTAGVIDADGTFSANTGSTTSRKSPVSARSSISAPATSATRSSTPPSGQIGAYICYERHFPEGWRELGLAGAHIVFNPSATSRGLSDRLWGVEGPAAAVANEYFVGTTNRVGREPIGDERLLRRATSSTLAASSSARPPRTARIASRATSTWMIRGTSHLGLLPGPSPGYGDLSRPSRPWRREVTHASSWRDGRQRRRSAAADVLIDGERVAAAPRCVAQLRPPGVRAPTASSTPPASMSSRAASTRHTHMEMPFGGTSRPTPSRPARGRRPGAARPRIVDFAIQTKGESLLAGSTPGTGRRRGSARSTTASTRSSPT